MIIKSKTINRFGWSAALLMILTILLIARQPLSTIRFQVSFLQLLLIILLVLFSVIPLTGLYLKRKKQLHEQEDFKFQQSNLLKTLIDHMPDYMYIKDTKSRFLIANKILTQNEEITDPKRFIGKTDFDFHPKESAEKFFKDEQKIMKTRISIIQKEEIVNTSDQKKIFLSTTKVPWVDSNENVLGIIGIGRDITKLKLFENELLQQAKNLQEVNLSLKEKNEQINSQSEELSAQAENLRSLNHELHKINDTKDKFISIIAHDLKNPFNAIINFSELLIIKSESTSNPKQMEMINIINSSSKMAYSLLENLLYWGKSQNSAIPFRPVTLKMPDLVKESTDFHEVSAKLKNIVIINEVVNENSVFADHTMTTTILRNLVSNAIKFTPKNGEIRITCEPRGNFMYTTVTDSGLGISKQQLEKLFQPDVETTKGTSGESGTGLGLVLSKEFALRNGGDIFVKSILRKGSSFILSLPLPPKIKSKED